MKSYPVQFRQVLRAYPGVANLFIGVPGVAGIAGVLFFMHPQHPDVTLSGIVFFALASLWYLWFLVITLSFALVATLRDDGMLVLWSPFRRLKMHVGEITAVIRVSRRPRKTAYQRRVELLLLIWRGGIAGVYVAREQMEDFLTGLTDDNPAIQMIGFPEVEHPAPVFAHPSEVGERVFTIRKAGNVLALIRHGAELAFVVLLCWRFYDGPGQALLASSSLRTQIIMLALAAGVLLFVGFIARSVWAALTTPLAVRLTADGMIRLTNWFGARRISTKTILAIRVTRRYQSWWAEITYHIGARDRNLIRRMGFPTIIMPNFLEFVAAIRANNPAVELESV